MTPEWTSKSGFWAPDSASIANRAKTVRHFLRERPEKNIVLVAHGDVLRQITCHAGGPSTYMWKNAEVQVWKLDPATVDSDDCFLVLDEVIEAASGWARTDLEIEPNGVDGVVNGKI